MLKRVKNCSELYKSISIFVNDHSIFKNQLHKYTNIVNGAVFRVILNQCAT